MTNIIPELQADLDLERYQGLWYTAASIPQFFDKNTAWKTAEYMLIAEENNTFLAIRNTGYNDDNSIRSFIEGRAVILDPEIPAALYVSFPSFPFVYWLDVLLGRSSRANYLIHKTDYDNYAIVGSYDGSNLYLLVRKRPISRRFYNKLLKYSHSLGYDTDLLREDYDAIL